MTPVRWLSDQWHWSPNTTVLSVSPWTHMELTGFCQCPLISTGSCGTHTLSLSINCHLFFFKNYPKAGILEGVWICTPGVTWQFLQTAVASILAVSHVSHVLCVYACLSQHHDRMQCSPRSLCHCDFSTSMGCHLELWATTNPSFLKFLLSHSLDRNWENMGPFSVKTFWIFSHLLKPRAIFIKNKYSLMFSYSKTNNNKTQRTLSNSSLAWLFLFLGDRASCFPG